MPILPVRQRRLRDPEGRMTLGEHLRELRNRVVVVAAAIIVLTIVAWFFRDPIFRFLTDPFCDLVAHSQIPTPELPTSKDTPARCPLFFSSVVQPLILQLKVCAIVATVAASPVWFYELWAFVTPGLRRNERKWSALFLSTAVPLFVGGAVLAYLVLSKGLHILLGLIPDEYAALITIDHYFSYAAAILAIFGVGFELPLLVTMLNLAGVLTFERLKKWQRPAILVIFAFAAVATPTADPFTMLALAAPMTALFEAAVAIAYFNDKRKERNSAESAYAELDDDETSPLEMDSTDL